MSVIDLNIPLQHEYDVVEGSYCIECFSPPGWRYANFFNGHGPFCNKKCFAKYIGIDYGKLPKLNRIGKIK